MSPIHSVLPRGDFPHWKVALVHQSFGIWGISKVHCCHWCSVEAWSDIFANDMNVSYTLVICCCCLLLLLCYVCGASIFTLSVSFAAFLHISSMFFWYLLHWKGLWWKHILMPLPNQWEQCFPTRSTKKYATNTGRESGLPASNGGKKQQTLGKSKKKKQRRVRAKQQNSKWRKRKSRQAESGEPNKVHKQTSARKTETCFTWIVLCLQKTGTHVVSHRKITFFR